MRLPLPPRAALAPTLTASHFRDGLKRLSWQTGWLAVPGNEMEREDYAIWCASHLTQVANLLPALRANDPWAGFDL